MVKRSGKSRWGKAEVVGVISILAIVLAVVFFSLWPPGAVKAQAPDPSSPSKEAAVSSNDSQPTPTPQPAELNASNMETSSPLVTRQETPVVESVPVDDLKQNKKPFQTKTRDVASESDATAPSSANQTGTSDDASHYNLPSSRKMTPRDISLPKALADALANNLDIQIKSLDEGMAQDVIRQAGGAFNPAFKADGTYENIDKPQNTQDFAATGGTLLGLNSDPRIFQEENWRVKASIEGKLPTGTQYEFFSRFDILRNTLQETSALNLFAPEYQSFTGVTLTQPLWKNFGTDVNLAELRVARKNHDISEQELRSQMLQIVAQVMEDYYDLSYLVQDMRLKEEERDLALKMTDERRGKLERGQISPRDLSRSESALAETIEDLTTARNLVIQKQTQLVAMLMKQYSNPEFYLFNPTSKMPSKLPILDEAQLLNEAFVNRPEYKVARYKVERENIRLIYAENQIWPQVDLKSTAGYNGLGGEFEKGYTRAFGSRAGGAQWSVGLTVTVPLGNDVAIGSRNEALKRKEQALLGLKQVEINTSLMVQQLVAIVKSNYERLDAMRMFRENASKGLENEEIRLEKGLTTEMDILKFKRDLSEARTRELSAMADINKALVRLYMTTGTLLERQNIKLTE